MARPRSITVGAVNVRIHPHDDARYAELFQDAFALRRAVKVFGNQRVILERLDRSQAEEGVLSGSLARFTEIDPDLPWFNAERFERADESEVAKVSIPSELRPNYVSVFFQLSLGDHLFVFESRGTSGSLSPRSALMFLDNLLNSDELVQKYGSASVSLVSDKDQLDAVIGMHRLRKLEILVKRPNPDDLGSYDAIMERRLLDQGAASVRVEYEASAHETIKPDENTRKLAESATRNGLVKAEGSDATGRRVVRSTDDHPALEGERYDPALRTEQQAFRSAATNILKRFLSFRV